MDVLIALDRTGAVPLRDQVYEGLRTAILDGRVGAGARLPSTRALAAQLGLSRFTVGDAYGRLVAEGYAAGRQGSGTYVAAGAVTTPHSVADGSVPLSPSPVRQWSSWGERLGSLPPVPDPASEREFDFRHALPALDAFPHALWRRLVARAARDVSLGACSYGPGAGLPVLRNAIAAYLARSRAVPCTAEQVVVTDGTQQTLDLLARLWLDAGDEVAVEEPGYPTARRAFALAGAWVVPVPTDADGLRVESLPALVPRAKLVYVTPSHQYPTGGVLPLARRRALLAWVREREALVMEDDYDAEFRYGARRVPALAGLDAAGTGPGRVVYVGTFSKVLYPALRLGYAVLPPDMVERFIAAKTVADRHAPTLEQSALSSFIAEGHFERHLARMRRLYAQRQQAMLAALAAELGDIARRDPAATAAGLHLLVALDLPLSSPEIVARAARAGIHLDPADACYTTPPPRPTFLLGYAGLDEEKIREGMRRLARVLGVRR